jgi:hypothetical protein
MDDPLPFPLSSRAGYFNRGLVGSQPDFQAVSGVRDFAEFSTNTSRRSRKFSCPYKKSKIFPKNFKIPHKYPQMSKSSGITKKPRKLGELNLGILWKSRPGCSGISSNFPIFSKS